VLIAKENLNEEINSCSIDGRLYVDKVELQKGILSSVSQPVRRVPMAGTDRQFCGTLHETFPAFLEVYSVFNDFRSKKF
jgi:hypothetical protein